jgi:predicted metal-dependent hydrolase
MDRHFAYGNISFDYTLMREKRKTISATVFPSRALIVKAPQEATDDRIYEFLQRKFRWILKQQRYFEQFGSGADKRYVSGETFQYRGRSYKLLLRKGSGSELVSLQHGTLTVSMFSPKNHTRAKKLLEEWYLEKANKVFSERLSACLVLFDYKEMPDLVIRKLSKRWGSYLHSTNKILLNPELIKASTRHIDYVIIHELCHIAQRQHNRAFYDLLEYRLPQWEKLKTELELSLLGGSAIYSE